MAGGRGGPVTWAHGALLLVICLWLAGISLPIMVIDRLLMFRDDYTILNVTWTLFGEGEWLLALIVGGFTVAAPLYKFERLFRLSRCIDASEPETQRVLQHLSWISNWSMADVFVVAMVVVIAKTSGFLADASAGPGLYFFAGSAVGSTVLGHALKRRVEDTAARQKP
ncbi:MAG: paraquat-inducible protein A [Hyphomicrobiales bacterium]